MVGGGNSLETPGWGPKKCECAPPKRKPKECQFPPGYWGSWAEASRRSVRSAGAKGAAAFEARSQPALSS